MKSEDVPNVPSVLIADDDPTIRQVLSINLKKRNFIVYQAENGRQVVDFLAHTIPDLVVLDLSMPVMNGTEVCDWIQQHGIDVPILVLTALSDSELKVHMLNAGADDYMTKPFVLEEFLARVRALLRRSVTRR